MNEDIKAWIQELKEIEEINRKQRLNLMELDAYFKYSGEIEEYKEEYKWEKNTNIQERAKSDNPIIQFYFDNCTKYTIKEMSKKLKIGEGTVRYVLSKHFNNKKIEKWKKH